MKYDAQSDSILLSVTQLCRSALIGGSIDARRPQSFSSLRLRAEEGKTIHKAVQTSADESEVFLSEVISYKGINFRIVGRADAIYINNGELTVEEIKSVSAYDFYSKPDPTHIAQLICYAFLLCGARGLSSVHTRLTRVLSTENGDKTDGNGDESAEIKEIGSIDIAVNIDDRETKTLSNKYTYEFARLYVMGLLEKILFLAVFLRERETVRMPAVAKAKFPYPQIREGQKELILACFRAIRSGKRLFAQAPTGTGKTMSVLYPSVKALTNGRREKIFYLTAKASTRREAFAAARRLCENGFPLKTLILTAKEQCCICDAARQARRNAFSGADDMSGRGGSFCTPELCPYADGFYDRLYGALGELLYCCNGYSASAVIAAAEKHRVCPYELSLFLSEYCDIIICDYNYVFDPYVYLKRYFAPTDAQLSPENDNSGAYSEAPSADSEKYIFLIDEAHNLASRATDIYSATLTAEMFDKLLSGMPPEDVFFTPFLQMTEKTRALSALCADTVQRGADGFEYGYYVGTNPPDEYVRALREFYTLCDIKLRALRYRHTPYPLADAVESVLFEVRRFCDALDRDEMHENGKTYIEMGGGKLKIRLLCLNPSRLLDRCLKRAYASVLFSATLTPLDYFRDILGGRKNSAALSLSSPFAEKNLCIAAVDSVSTRFDDRDAGNYRRLSSYIAAAVSVRKGNYICYFPSYSYCNEVAKVFNTRFPKVKTIIQKPKMPAAEREKFLEFFSSDENRLRVGFCVLGGSFSEGIDLPGSRLIGTVIVGVGIPGLSTERNLLRDYYENKIERGFDYAYTYPGMNNVMQAAGRVIRREDDRGIVVLIDDRYSTEIYKQLFPPHWKHLQYAGDAESLAEIIRRFYEGSCN